MSTEYLNNKMFEEVISKFQNSKREKSKYEICIEDLEGAINRGNDCVDFIMKLNKFSAMHKTVSNIYTETQQQLAMAFLTLSENIVRYAKFNLIDIDDAIQEGVMICFEKIDRFDSLKGKAFNYFTTCALNHFRQLYRSAKNYNELKKKYLAHLELEINNCFKNHRKINNLSKNSGNYTN